MSISRRIGLVNAFVLACIASCASLDALGQCTASFSLVKTSPSGPICSLQSVTFQALYTEQGSYIEGEFRWYRSDVSETTPVYTQVVGTDHNWYSNYGFQAQEGTTTVYVSFYNYQGACESYKDSYIFSIGNAPSFTQQYARQCGDGIGKIQFSSGPFSVYKLNAGSYDYVGGTATSYFELTDFYGLDADKYYVVQLSPYGCQLSTYIHIDFDIQTNSSPTVSGTSSFCQGIGTTLTASGGNGSFQWYDGSGNQVSSSSQLNVSPSFSAGSYSYSVERISPQGCVTNRANTTVTVLARPVNGNISASQTTVCLGDPVTISATGGVGEYHYWADKDNSGSWDALSSQHTGQSSFSFTATEMGVYRFYLKNKTSCGLCGDSGNSCSATPYVDVHVTQSVGGVTHSSTTGQILNTVLTENFDQTALTGQVGSVLNWEYSNEIDGVGSYVSLGQAGLTTSTTTCCISDPGQTIWLRAQVQNGGCPAAPSSSTAYTWKLIPPIVEAGSDTFIDTRYASVSLTGRASVAAGTISSYSWSRVSGGALNLTNASSAVVTVSGYSVGEYVLRLTVTDNQSQTASDDVRLIVTTADDQNYIRSYAAIREGLTQSGILSSPAGEKMLSTAYFDGFGRQVQTVNWQATSLLKDLVLPVQYDDYGREAIQYLPYGADENDGLYKADALRAPSSNSNNLLLRYQTGQQYEFYQPGGVTASDVAPYAKTVFEASPLDRTAVKGAPGFDWQPENAHAVTKTYKTNAASEVLSFIYDNATGLVALATGSAKYYGQNQLTLMVTTDEQGSEVVEYKNKLGQVICKKVQYGNDGTGKLYASTYYIYDDFGSLVVVLPPEGVKEFLSQQ